MRSVDVVALSVDLCRIDLLLHSQQIRDVNLLLIIRLWNFFNRSLFRFPKIDYRNWKLH